MLEYVPKIFAGGLETVSFTATKDTFITPSSYNPSNGERRMLVVGQFYDTTIDAYYERAKALIKFDNLNIPAGAIIQSAKLELWHYATATWGSGTGNYTTYVSKMTQDWSENVVWGGPTNGNGGLSFAGDYGSYTFPDYDTIQSSYIQKREINLNSALINELISGQNYGIMLNTYSAQDGGFAVCSVSINDGFCTASHAPKLVVQFIVNQKPYTPNPVYPVTQSEFSGNCDESVIPDTGDCRTGKNIELKVDGLGDGDVAPGDYNSTTFTAGSYTSNAINTQPEATWNNLFLDGVYNWNAKSVDNMGLWSNDSATYTFTVDTTPSTVPVANTLPEWTAGVGIDSTKQVEPTSLKSSDNVFTQSDISYYLEYSLNSDFTGSVFSKSWQLDDPSFEIGPKGTDNIADTEDDIIDNQTYYFRIKSKDKLNNVSSFSNTVFTSIDGTKPTLQNYTASDLRFSPNNASSLGIKDNVNFAFDYLDLHPHSAKIEIFDINNNIVKTLSSDISVNEGMLASQNIEFNWNGTNNNGEYLPDGVYKAVATVLDKAGNTNEGNFEQILVIDNSEANVQFSSPIYNLWTNQDAIDLTGQVTAPHVDGKEDRDLSEFKFSSDNINWNNVNFDELGLFTQSLNLVNGTNTIYITTKDLVGNVQNKIWDIETSSNKDLWIINKDTTAPQISNINPVGLSNNRKPTLTFTLEDLDPTNDGSQRSDLALGSNTNNASIWLTYYSLTNGQLTEKTFAILEDGVKIDNALTDNLTCVAANGSTQSVKNNNNSSNIVDCSLPFIAELQPDTTYFLHIKAFDNAGNHVLDESKSFTLDSNIYSTVSAPISGGVYSTSSILFKGEASKGSTLTISNTQLNQTRSFTLNELLDETGLDTFIKSNFQVTCSTFKDVDGRSDTPEEETCSWEVRVSQDYFAQNKDKVNNNIVMVSDQAGNSIVHNFDITVNLYNFDLTVQSDLNYFSPNGDGKQDSFSFFHSATNPTDPNNPPIIQSYTLLIKDDKNRSVKEFGGNGFIPAFTFFDGKITDPNNSNKTIWLPDGVYTYTLSATTTDGAALTTAPKNFFAKTVVNGEVYITNPVNGFVTTSGVIAVQGQAPIGDYTVTICVDTITTPNNVSCDMQESVKADENGFYSTLIVLPRISGQTQTLSVLKAYASDLYGNLTTESNNVQVTLDTLNPFINIDISPELTGITSQADYDRFLNGELSINQIRTLSLTANVSENTEAVQFSYADYTNLSEKPQNPAYNYIALVNNTTETNPLLNPLSDPLIKKNLNKLLGESIDSANCNSASCTWKYIMPVNPTLGGIYEVEFKGKKGETIQSMTSGFRVDNTIPASPVFMTIEYWDDSNNVWVRIDPSDLNNYTNGYILRFRGAAEPGTYLELKSSSVVLGSLTVPETGIWEFIVDLTNYLTQPGNGNGNGLGLECREWKQGVGNERKCVDGTLDFTLVTYDPITGEPIPSDGGLSINYDEIAPIATSIERSTPERTVAGWVKTGDQVSYTLESNEKLKYSDLVKEDGFVRTLSNVFEQTKWSGVINIDRKQEGFYSPSLNLIDLGNNKTTYSAQEWESYGLGDFRVYIDNTLPNSPTLDKSGWGGTIADGGVNADGVNPEVGRTNPDYVTKSDVITIKGKAEKNQRVELYVNNKFKVLIPVTSLNCVSESDNKLAKDGLVVKYGEVCDYSYNLVLTDAGINDIFGVPLDYYIIQVRTIDSAANVSDWVNPVIVYHDKQAPNKPVISNISSSSYNPIPNFSLSGGVTKDTSVSLKSVAERFSDLQYSLINPNGVKSDYPVAVNSSTQVLDTQFNLGEQITDDREGCVQVINGKRTGVCSDGIYEFNLTSTDAAGNKSETLSGVKVERDTVAPIKINAYAYLCGLNICINVNEAEPNTTILINGRAAGRVNTAGNEGRVIALRTYSENTNYSFKLSTQDSSENTSDIFELSFKTDTLGRGEGDVLGTEGYEFGNITPINLLSEDSSVNISINSSGEATVTKFDLPAPLITFIRAQPIYGNYFNIYGIALNKNFEIKTTAHISKESLTYGEAIVKCNTFLPVPIWDYNCMASTLELSDWWEYKKQENSDWMNCTRQYFWPWQLSDRNNCFMNTSIKSTGDVPIVLNMQNAEVKVYNSEADITYTRDCNVGQPCHNGSTQYWNDHPVEGYQMGQWEIRLPNTAIQTDQKVRSKLKIYADFTVDFNSKSYTGNFGKDGWESNFSNEVSIPKVATFSDLVVSPVGHPSCNGVRFTSTYGWRLDPFTGESTLHDGVDLAKSEGCEIVSVYAGHKSNESGYGNTVKIVHEGTPFTTIYGHGRNYIGGNEWVDKNVSVLYMGNTGRSTGVHLHFTLREGCSEYRCHTDPLPYFKLLFKELPGYYE